MSKSTKQTTKTAKKTTKTAAPAPTPRVPLEPLTGPIGPLPVSKFAPEDHRAERVALRKTEPGGDRYALSDVIFHGLAEDGEDPIDLATVTLENIHDEATVLGRALDRAEHGEEARTAYALGNRAKMVAELCRRIETARKTETHPELIGAPPAYEVAAALVTLPGVLSAPTTRERLQRIAERLDVAIVVGGAFMEHWAAGYGETRSVYLAGDLEGQRKPAIHIDPREPDHDWTIAYWLGHVVAKREGYGNVANNWCNEIARVLLDRGAAAKGAA